MVIIMQSKNINHCIHDYINKPQRNSAQKLHKLFNQYSAPFQSPTARELIIEKLTWWKWFEKEYQDYKRENSGSYPALYPRLDCTIYGRKLCGKNLA